MKRKYVLISIISKTSQISTENKKNLLSLFYNEYQILAPNFANFCEPINQPISSVETALPFLGDKPSLFKRKSKILGIWDIAHDIDNKLGFIFKYQWNNQINWLSLFTKLINFTDTHFAYMHVFTEKELEPAGLGSAISCFTGGTPAWALRKNGIPQLAWANYWGKEYTQELTDSIKQELSPYIQPLDQGHIFHLTENIEDIINNYEFFDQRRQHIKRMFRPGLFQNYARYEHESKFVTD